MTVFLDVNPGGEALVVSVDVQSSLPSVELVLLDEDHMVHAYDLSVME